MNSLDHCYAQWATYKEKAKGLLRPSHRKWMYNLPQTRREARESHAYLQALNAEHWWRTAAKGWYAQEVGAPETMCEFSGRYIPGIVRMTDYLKERPMLAQQRPEWAKYLR